MGVRRADGAGAFVVSRAYTRDEIHDALGGSKQAYLPTVGGEVVAVCVGTAKNPQAPRRILVGTKPRVVAAAGQLVNQPSAVPVFLKRRSNEWVYQGRYSVADVCRDDGRLAEAAREAGRDALHMWIDLEPADG